MNILTVLYWILGIYLFLAVLIFYMMLNNIFFLRSIFYDFNIDRGIVEEGQLEDPKIQYYLVKQNNQPNKDQNWVVLLHSWGRNAQRMVDRGKIYFDHGYSLLFVDGPGHGKSGWVPVIKAPDYAKFTEKIMEKEEITNPVVHGLSFGSIAGLFVSTHVKVRAFVAEALTNNFHDMYDGFFAELKLPKSLYGWIPNFILKIGDDWEQYQPYKLLRELQCPVFLIHGEFDQMFPVKSHFYPNKAVLEENHNIEVFTWIVDDSPHSKMSRYEGYQAKIENFIEFLDEKSRS